MTTLDFIDCSNNNGTVNWADVKRAGIHGAYCKATEGVNFHDQTYATNRRGCAGQGLLFGAYHFAQPSQSSGTSEADFFLEAASVKPGDLVPCLDYETNPITASWAEAFARRVHDHLGVYPMIYATPGILAVLGASSVVRHCPIWVASWSSTKPSPPPGWRSVSMWQYSGHGHCPGVAGECDRDTAYTIHQYKPPTVWTVRDGAGHLIARTNHPKLWVALHRPFRTRKTVTFHKT